MDRSRAWRVAPVPRDRYQPERLIFIETSISIHLDIEIPRNRDLDPAVIMDNLGSRTVKAVRLSIRAVGTCFSGPHALSKRSAPRLLGSSPHHFTAGDGANDF